MAKPFPKRFNSAIEFTLAVLGGKWKAIILCYLQRRSSRYSDLRALLPELSEKVLSERLRDLMALGLVVRKRSPAKGASSVYALTPKGLSLSKLLHDLYEWGREHAESFGVELGGHPLESDERKRAATD